MRLEKIRRRQHIPGRCAGAATTRLQKHRETASAVRAALLVEHHQAFARKPRLAQLQAVTRALRDPRFAASAALPRPRGRKTDYRPDRPHSSPLQADPWGDMLDSLR